MRRNRKAVAKYLFSLGILEGRAFQLFLRISEKVELPLAKFSLLYVAYDSLKNSVILGNLSQSAVPEVRTKNHETVLGEVWKMVNDFSKEILKMETITKENLLSFADKLVRIYAVKLVQLKTLGFMSREISEAYDIDLEIIKGVLELVVEDEETDTQILMGIKDLFVEKTRRVADDRPMVKYTHPNAWHEPVMGAG
jgi:hypothetical protein